MVTQLGGEFSGIAAAVADFEWRPEVEVVEIEGPSRLAPYALAFDATVGVGEEPGATGRLVVLHNPAGDDAWNGRTRFVTMAKAQVDYAMGLDPMLADVAWSWLTDALRHAGADYAAASGTATTSTSRSFGNIEGQADRAEIEMRCSWTARDDAHVSPHVAAWQELLCQLAGLEPLIDGVITLRRPR